MTHEKPLLSEFVTQALTTDFEIVESKSESSPGLEIPFQRITLRIEPDDVETSAFGIIYMISLLSFLQGRPAGASEMYYQARDMWSVEDCFRGLSFARGKLCFDADYVRGRLMKTRITISADGTVVIETVNRADQASQWAQYLLRKQGLLEFIGEDGLTVQ